MGYLQVSYFCLYPQFCCTAYLMSPLHIHLQLHTTTRRETSPRSVENGRPFSYEQFDLAENIWWAWVRERARPPQAATIYSLSYSLLTSPQDALHRHCFLHWKHTSSPHPQHFFFFFFLAHNNPYNSAFNTYHRRAELWPREAAICHYL